jgi:hypothetical protein
LLIYGLLNNADSNADYIEAIVGTIVMDKLESVRKEADVASFEKAFDIFSEMLSKTTNNVSQDGRPLNTTGTRDLRIRTMA